MCQLISGFYHEKKGVQCRLFVPSHNNQAPLHGIENELKKPPELQNVVKWECTPPVKLEGFWDAANWDFRIDQDITPDWCSPEFVGAEVRSHVQGMLDDCPDTREADIPTLDGRYLAVRGDGCVLALNYSVVLFIPDKTTIHNAWHATIHNVGAATIHNAGHATIQYAGDATIGEAGHATIEYAGNATIRDARHATIQGVKHQNGTVI